MKIVILSVGALKAGPEKDLFDDYCQRFRKSARAQGFRSLDIIDVESGGGLEAEGKRLLAKIPAGARLVRLDEYGAQHSSKTFATRLSKWRDQGTDTLCFVIGGAAGFAPAIVEAATDAMAFGPQTWPHRLVKVMLAEQIYRAASMMAGTPYHKA